MAVIEARLARPADIEEWYEGPSPGTVRAYVVTLDGKVAGIAGLILPGLGTRWGAVEAFSEMSPDLAPHLRHPLVQWAISRVIRLIRKSRVPVMAIADRKLPTSEPLLKRLGAVPIGRTDDGEVYLWKQ